MDSFPPKVILITGMSGAGKSTALRCFEDLGYFCIDNIPPQLIETFLQLIAQMPSKHEGVALVCDVRSGALFDSLLEIWNRLKGKVESLSLLFLDASETRLIKRYSELRRQHPLALAGLSNEKALKEEKGRLEPLRDIATEVIDTTELSANKLTDTLRRLFYGGDPRSALTITLMSFGYKYGIPADADFVFDTRFLPNPFYVDELKELDGTAKTVSDFVLSDENAVLYCDEIIGLLDRTLPGFESIQKVNVRLAIGCTGGKHRSVALAEFLKEKIKETGRRVLVIHRDIDRP